MKTRDVATIAFRLLALWIVMSAVTALTDLLFNWKSISAQVMGSFSGVANAPTQTALFWMSATAFGARAVVGVVAWWLAPVLARGTSPSDGIVMALGREELYSAASFLIGLYLVAISLPALVFEGYVATKPGFPAHPEAHEQVPLLLAQLVLGIALIRGRWLVKWAMGAVGPGSSASTADGAVQQRDGLDPFP